MPAKKRKSKMREQRLTPEVFAAFDAGDECHAAARSETPAMARIPARCPVTMTRMAVHPVHCTTIFLAWKASANPSGARHSAPRSRARPMKVCASNQSFERCVPKWS